MELLQNMSSNVKILAAYLCAKDRINSDEQRSILSKETNRQKVLALLMCVQRKGWVCLQELSYGLKLPDLHPLHKLSRELDRQMKECGSLITFPLFQMKRYEMKRYVHTYVRAYIHRPTYIMCVFIFQHIVQPSLI